MTAYVYDSAFNDVKTYYNVECSACGCCLWSRNTEKEAIKQWNTRSEIKDTLKP